jgi:DNA-binding response OmpR family regulator
MRVLLAEDHIILADRIAEGLRDAGQAVDVANDGSAALTQAGLTDYDVIVLDRGAHLLGPRRQAARQRQAPTPCS